jgi:hypothetical protein
MKDGKYINISIIINDEADQYGNNVAIIESQTKEEREAKEKKNYLGNGKVVWGESQKQSEDPFDSSSQEDDSLPF